MKSPLEELNPADQFPNGYDKPGTIVEGSDCRCEHCGGDFEAYKNGGVLIFRTCKPCLDGRLKAGRKEQSDRAGRRLLVDFNGEVDQEILALLEASAVKNRRSVESEILCLLEGWFVLKGALVLQGGRE